MLKVENDHERERDRDLIWWSDSALCNFYCRNLVLPIQHFSRSMVTTCNDENGPRQSAKWLWLAFICTIFFISIRNAK